MSNNQLKLKPGKPEAASAASKKSKPDDSKSTKQNESNDDCDVEMNTEPSDSNPTTPAYSKLDTQNNSAKNSSQHAYHNRKDNQASYEQEFDQQNNNLIKIVCISDTHNGHEKKKFADKIRSMRGDILIHAGDFSENGTDDEVMSAFEWLCSLDNFKHKVFISGNMDGIGLDKPKLGNATLKRRKLFQNEYNVHYLENDDCEILGLKIYGCPYTPKFYGGFQYNPRSSDARELWNNIPNGCDILVSHGPPAGILDCTSRGAHVGCQDLKDAIRARKSLKTIIFGHVHHSYGAVLENGKCFINAAQYNGIYENNTHNEPIQVFLRRQDKSIYGILGLSAN